MNEPTKEFLTHYMKSIRWTLDALIDRKYFEDASPSEFCDQLTNVMEDFVADMAYENGHDGADFGGVNPQAMAYFLHDWAWSLEEERRDSFIGYTLF